LATIRAVAVKYGPDHELALQLFEHDSREAKIAATLVDDPAQVTPEQMDGWALEFLTGAGGAGLCQPIPARGVFAGQEL